MIELVTVAKSASEPRYALVYVLFIIAGLLVGGAWSAYKAENRTATFGLAICAAIALAAALLWLIGEMT
ncbi:hypothetical protein [Corynebacterium hindlerae]|uniref:hypothetical protein n=1 Tax=Corynebacterium hindlerae TaxID=699041 RepID=UPI0031B6A085